MLSKEAKHRAIFELSDGIPMYLSFDADKRTIEIMTDTTLFSDAVDAVRDLCKKIEFTTPERWINALDESIMTAADGIWDGSTWQHGAIGWRMSLAGWCGAYCADVLGWHDRAESHFASYAASQIKDISPIFVHPAQDSVQAMARAEKRLGTQMYSNGYMPISKLQG